MLIGSAELRAAFQKSQTPEGATMSSETSLAQQTEKSGDTALLVKRVLMAVFAAPVIGAILFLAAGTLDWPMAWAFTGVYLVTLVYMTWYLQKTDPEMIQERFERRAGTKGWDIVFVQFIKLFSSLGIWVVAGLDFRNTWSPTLSIPLQIAALVVWVLGFGVMFWSMAANTFFGAHVRIQDDRGHRPVSGGPYQYVRHPGYVGMIVNALATPLALGSLWALIPAGLAVLLLVIRTALEDKTLQAELTGYKDYAGQVRFRLLPGLW
jgi:protein-S-isoprenylcysteine O-methyltransferase Ste14